MFCNELSNVPREVSMSIIHAEARNKTERFNAVLLMEVKI